MPSILQKLFGRRGPSGDGGGAPSVALGLFGKHPAWNDFADDIGLETDRLVALKRLLFQGIDANIPQWEHLHEQQRLEAFAHVLVWVTGECVMVARLWASADGKGRSRYPMVACAECCGLPLAAVLAQVLPALEQVERDCVRATSQSEVHAVAESARGSLRRWAATAPAAADLTPAAAADRLLRCPDLGQGGRGLVSLLYRLDQEAPDLLTWGAHADGRAAPSRPAYVRVPACAQAPAEAALLWARFMDGVVARRAPRMIVLPLGRRWADVVVGEPTGASLYGLRATEKGVPLTSDIPYTIDEAFARRAHDFVRSLAASPATP